MQGDLQQSEAVVPEGDVSLWTHTVRRRVLLGLIALLCVVLLVVVPPYFSISRYQRRVAAAISGSLGRPVHFDNITVHLLPVPGLTISNFVVSENADFGAEPVLRANSVEARLRVSSLWRRRIEVSRISLDSPSINLVRRHADGRWNLQGILMQASQMNSAPTAQTRAGDVPRFPYIEATDARINIKDGDSKLPFSVKEAEFALWLPQPDQWRLRSVGKPVRTDTDVSDVGLLRVEATLGRAVDLEQAPIDLSVGWKPTPLGEAGKLTAGYDLGWRGEVSASATLRGSLGSAKLVTDVHVLGLRPADFPPDHAEDVTAHCEAAAAGLLRSLHDVRCAVPTDSALTLASVMETLRKLPNLGGDQAQDAVRPGVLLLQGDVPNVFDWHSATGSAALNDAPASYGLAWARLLTQGIPEATAVGGTFDLTASLLPDAARGNRWDATLTCACILPEVPAPKDAAHASPTVAKATQPNRWMLTLQHGADDAGAGSPVGFGMSAAPAGAGEGERVPSPDASEKPAAVASTKPVAVAGEVSRTGYVVRYRSLADVRQAAVLLPMLAEGVPPEASGALAASRQWPASQVWTAATPAERHAVSRPRRHARRR